MSSALYPVLGQPPHIGQIITTVKAAKDFDNVTVCVMDKDAVIKSKYAKQLFETAFEGYENIDVILDDADFDDISLLPRRLTKYDYILTTDNYRYAQLLSNGIENVKVVPRLIGVNDAFFMKAFHQSMALDRLNMNMVVKPIQEKKRK